jgi:hypothetical protein
MHYPAPGDSTRSPTVETLSKPWRIDSVPFLLFLHQRLRDFQSKGKTSPEKKKTEGEPHTRLTACGLIISSSLFSPPLTNIPDYSLLFIPEVIAHYPLLQLEKTITLSRVLSAWKSHGDP